MTAVGEKRTDWRYVLEVEGSGQPAAEYHLEGEGGLTTDGNEERLGAEQAWLTFTDWWLCNRHDGC